MSGPVLLPLDLAGLGGFCSTRQGGVSAGPYASLNLGANTDDDPALVLANRRQALEVAGLEPRRAVFLQQVHGAVVRQATAADAGRGWQSWADGLPGCDAVYTLERGLGLAIGQADCLAVLLVDQDAACLGLAHAGWRGALHGIAPALLERMVAAGADVARLKVLLSPCLGPNSLELGEAQHSAFRSRYSDLGHYSTALVQGRFHLDLQACVRRQLERAGVPAGGIRALELDTATQPELFFSHRRDQGLTGRMLTLAWLK